MEATAKEHSLNKSEYSDHVEETTLMQGDTIISSEEGYSPATLQRRYSIEPKNMHILVVDDDTLTLKIADKLLQKIGYINITLVESGRKAIEELESRNYDIIISDLRMPEIDGLELLKKSKEIQPGISFFLMSTSEEMDIVYHCLKSGADHYFEKPLKENDFKGLWQTLWTKRRESGVIKELSEEATQSSILKQKTAELETQIEKLKKEMHDAVELPVRIIGKEVETILAQAHLPAEIILSTMLKQLKKVDIYQQAFQKFLNESQIDPMSKKWLMNELAGSSDDDKSPIEWVEIDHSKSHEILRDWNFDVWSYSEEELLPLCEEMFEEFQLIDRFQIPREKLRNLLTDINQNYKKNPYHNFRHAFDVTQTVYLILTNANAASLLGYLEIMAILVAALMHDLGHPGVNNVFQVSTGSQLALTYNDKSVLENYHCSMAFSLLRKPENNIFCNLTQEQCQQVRTMIISSILATDLVLHMEIMGKWNACIVAGFAKDNKDHRNLLLQIILKCADIANPAKNFAQAKHWAIMVQEEFFAQGDKEKEKNLPVSPFMDRDKPALPRMQINFIEYLVQPLFSSLRTLMPDLSKLCDTLQDNKQKWLSLESAPQNGTVL